MHRFNHLFLRLLIKPCAHGGVGSCSNPCCSHVQDSYLVHLHTQPQLHGKYRLPPPHLPHTHVRLYVQGYILLCYSIRMVLLQTLFLVFSRTYRTLIYNGDVDGCVPYIGDEVCVYVMIGFRKLRSHFMSLRAMDQWSRIL